MRGIYDFEDDEPRGLVDFRVSGRAVFIDADAFEAVRHTLPDASWTTGSASGSRLEAGAGHHAVPMLRDPEAGWVRPDRLIAAASDRCVMRYRNGDPFDLRHCNLVVVEQSRRASRRAVPMPTLTHPTLGTLPGLPAIPEAT